jgi:hypothetical protein
VSLIRRVVAVSTLTVAAVATVGAGAALADEAGPATGYTCEGNNGTTTWGGAPAPSCADVARAATGYGARWAHLASGGTAPAPTTSSDAEQPVG